MREGTSWIAEIEAKERAASGITNLKIDYNKKDGYYFHVTNSNLSLVPDYFFRKATLKNSERFGTAELAKIEGEVKQEQSASLEYDIFMRVRAQVERYISRLQDLAKAISTVDVLQSLAVVAENNHYVRQALMIAMKLRLKKVAMRLLKSWVRKNISQIPSHLARR